MGVHLKNYAGTTILYFDAFAHDYRSKPLEARVAAFTDRIAQDGSKGKIRALKQTTAKLIQPLSLAALDAAVPRVGKLVKKVTKAFRHAEDNKATAMQDFRRKLESLVAAREKHHNSTSPAIIVIDELDRCRPDYALEILEVVKHLFTVPNLHFVLGVNLGILEDMVRLRYGTTINAHSYLSKFIQVTLELPDEVGSNHHRKKAVLLYLDHLVSTMGIKKHIADQLCEQVEIVAYNNTMSLRDIGRIVSAVALASNEVVENPKDENFLPGWIEIMNALIIAKTICSDLQSSVDLKPHYLQLSGILNHILCNWRHQGQDPVRVP